MSDISKHKRVNDILLGPLERPALQWLSAHMPAWVTPDMLTAVGVLGALVIFAGYVLTNIHPGFLWLASLGFVINWFGDSLDGSLARYRKIERPQYGFFIDHVVDAANEVIIFLGLGLSPYVRFDLACLALIGYLMLSVLVYIRTCVKGEFVISYQGLGPTEVRVLAIIANTLIFLLGNPLFTIAKVTLTVYDWLVIVVIGLLAIIFVVSAFNQARVLSKADR
jgi:phosphatidylglycerophosphate synthase